MNLNYSKQQFNENKRLFGDPKSNPEKYNLYAGLENLVVGLENMQFKLNAIEELLMNINKKK